MLDDDFEWGPQIALRHRGRTVAVALISLAVFALVLLALYRNGSGGAGWSVSCAAREAREGGPWVPALGLPMDDLRRSTSYRLIERRVEHHAAAGSVVRVSACDVPEGADFMVYVASGSS